MTKSVVNDYVRNNLKVKGIVEYEANSTQHKVREELLVIANRLHKISEGRDDCEIQYNPNPERPIINVYCKDKLIDSHTCKSYRDATLYIVVLINRFTLKMNQDIQEYINS